MAPRLKTSRPGLHHALLVAGLVALALLALGEQAPAAFPVHVRIEGHTAVLGTLEVSVDGQTHSLSSVLGGDWRGVAPEQPGPFEREYQIDGSDTTSTTDRDPSLIRSLLDTPLYRLAAWLRDEGSYSRWEDLSITDLSTGAVLASDAPLPRDFLLDVSLRRPEAAARLWLLGPTDDRREGLELDRDKRNARWLIQRGGGTDALPRWYFPEQPAPFAAELLHLLGRSAAAGYALVLAALGLGWLIRLSSKLPERSSPPVSAVVAQASVAERDSGVAPVVLIGAFVPAVLLGGWLIASALVAARVFHQLPHILDAVSYTFQAGLFSVGQLSLAAPPLADAFKGPFEVAWQGRIFSQYPPGAAAVYALGRAISLEWLVGPLACLALVAATAWTARALFGSACGLVVLGLGVLSPFVLFQSGSFLSHPIAGGLLACALAAFVAGEQRGSARWYAICGLLLGAGFVVRESASILFGLPLGVRLLLRRRWGPLADMLLFGVPFLLAYLLYDVRETGSALLLPRTLFDAADHFGFGDGIGFHTRHTLAAGLANADELLTVLQLDLFGWPPVFTLGLLLVPFLLGRSRGWDLVAAGGFLVFVVAHVGYFYHGIALGPRYYFEAVPWLLLLGGRGVQVLAGVAGNRLAPLGLVGALMLNTVMFYTPAELARRTDLSGMPGGIRVSLGFVDSSLLGPRLSGVPKGSLVVTDEWWVYNTALAALNCPTVPDCDVLFALGTTPAEAEKLRAAYPDRRLMKAVNTAGHIDVVPY